MRMFLANSCKCSLLTRGNEAMKPKDIHTANKEIRDQTKISASLGAKKDCLTPCCGQQISTEVSVTVHAFSSRCYCHRINAVLTSSLANPPIGVSFPEGSHSAPFASELI